MATILDIPKELLKAFFSVKENISPSEIDSMSQKNLKAFLQHKGIDSFLKYRTYIEDEEGLGIYTMADGKKGIIFRVYPNPNSATFVESSVYNLVDMFREEDTYIFLNTFASRNIANLLHNFKALHPCNVNIGRVDILKEMMDKTYKFLQDGVNKSIIERFDNRIRDFISTVGILFPQDTPDIEIKQKYYQVLGNLSKINAVPFTGTHLIQMLKEMVNPDQDMAQWNNLYDKHRVMNKQIASTNTRIRTKVDDGTIDVGKEWKYRVFTTKQFPNENNIITNFDLYNLIFDRFRDNKQSPIPCPFFISLVIQVGDIEKIKNKALAKSRDDLIKVSKLNRQVRESDPDLQGRRTEAKRTIKLLTQDHELLYHGMFSITLMDSSENNLNKYSKVLMNRFSENDWIIEDEKFGNIALFILLYSLPLQEDPIVTKELKRMDMLFTSNCAGIAPILGNFSNMDMIIPVFDGNWQLLGYDNFSGDAYNEASTGQTGAGKSMTQAYKHIMRLGAGVKQRVIDNGRSYGRLAEVLGGSVIDIERDKNISLNFFTKAALLCELDENGKETNKPVVRIDENGNKKYMLHETEIKAIVPIIGLMVGLDFVLSGRLESSSDATDRTYLESIITKCVIGAFERHQFNTNLEHVRELILYYHKTEKEKENKPIADLLWKIYQGLFDFADKQGAHYIKFNTPNNINLDSDYIILETSGLEGRILKVTVVTLASAIRAEFWKEGPVRRKTLDIDEGWKYVDDNIVIKILDDNTRTFRKSKSGQCFITQSIEDFDTNDSTRALFKNAYHKFLLAQDMKTVNKVTSQQGFFHLNTLERRIFGSVANKKPDWGEAMYVAKNAPAQAVIIKTAPEVFWLISAADPDGSVLFQETQKKYGLTLIQTVRYLAEKTRNKELSHNDLMNLAKNYNETKLLSDMKQKEYWKDEIKSALRENRVIIKLEPMRVLKDIGNKDIATNKYEALTEIHHKDNSISNFKSFYHFVKEFDIENDYLRAITTKLFDFMAKEDNRDIEINFNIDSDKLSDQQFISILFEQIKIFRVKDRITLEIKDISSLEDEEILTKFIEKTTTNGIKVLIDNVSKDYHNMSFLVGIDCYGFKIDGNLVRESMSNNTAKFLLDVFIDLAKKHETSKRVFINKIETSSEIEFLSAYKDCEQFYIQGKILQDETKIF